MPTLRLQRTHGYWKLVFCLLLLSVFLIPKNAKASTDTLLFSSESGSMSFEALGTNDYQKTAVYWKPKAFNWLCYLKFKAYKVGTPVDSLAMDIFTDFSAVGGTDSILLSPISVLGSSFPTGTTTYVTYTLPNCTLFSPQHGYYFYFARTGSISEVNYFMINKVFSNPFSNTFLWEYNKITGYFQTAVSKTWGIKYYGDTDTSSIDLPNMASTSNPFGACGTLDVPCQIGNGIYKVLTWLFIPSDYVFNEWTGLWDTVKAKPPVGYFTQAQTAIGSFSVASGSFYLTMDGMSGITDPLRTGLVMILWLMFGFWIFHRVRKMEI